MTIFEIDEKILNCIDVETGEVDTDALDALQLERNNKIDNIIKWIKELRAEAAAISAEIDSLVKRLDSRAAKADRLTAYLETVLRGEEFRSASCEVRYRKSPAAVKIADEAVFLEKYPNFAKIKQAVSVDRVALKAAIKSGKEFDGAVLESKNNMIIM